MDTLDYILKRFNLDPYKLPPIEIPDTGRVTLAQLFGKLGFKVGAEIGVLEGEYAEILCRYNPGVRLYCVDPWDAYPGYPDYPDQGDLDRRCLAAVERLKPYDAVIITRYSMDAVSGIENNSLDFVYIDANHDFPHVAEDIFYWSQKVRPGGIVSGHDYHFPQVAGAVHGYTQAFGIKPWFILGTAKRIPGEMNDRARSWFWVKGEK